jgi:hypothetical protein
LVRLVLLTLAVAVVVVVETASMVVRVVAVL